MTCVVDRVTGIVQDINQRYDERYFDHLDVPDGTIPNGADWRSYMRNPSGDIVLRPARTDAKREAIARATTLDELKAALLLP